MKQIPVLILAFTTLSGCNVSEYVEYLNEERLKVEIEAKYSKTTKLNLYGEEYSDGRLAIDLKFYTSGELGHTSLPEGDVVTLTINNEAIEPHDISWNMLFDGDVTYHYYFDEKDAPWILAQSEHHLSIDRANGQDLSLDFTLPQKMTIDEPGSVIQGYDREYDDLYVSWHGNADLNTVVGIADSNLPCDVYARCYLQAEVPVNETQYVIASGSWQLQRPELTPYLWINQAGRIPTIQSSNFYGSKLYFRQSFFYEIRSN